MKTKICNNHVSLLNSLIVFIQETEKKVIDASDVYFTDNVNFFCKSFLITTCTYLESYLKAAATVVVEEVNERLKKSVIPSNIAKWSLEKSKDLKVFKYEPFTLDITEKDIDDNLSGSVDRTLTFFRKLGLDLDSSKEFINQKDTIGPVIKKRNNIVHYNDDASDLSFGDIRLIIKGFITYIEIIDECVCSHINPSLTSPFI